MDRIKKDFEVKVFKSATYCECGGELEFTGFKYSYMNEDTTGSETKYWHKCNKCQKEVSLINEFYPQIRYEEVKFNNVF